MIDLMPDPRFVCIIPKSINEEKSLDTKARRVRTPEGQERFKQPIGSVIVADAVPQVVPRIMRRAEDVVGTPSSIVGSAVTEVVKPGPSGSIGGAPETELIYGAPISRSDLPETVYHVTTNAPSIRRSGIVQASSGGGLGGSHKDSVSVTVDKDVADQLLYDLRMYATLIKSNDTNAVIGRLREEFERLDMTGFGEIERTMDVYTRDGSAETFGSSLDSIMSLFFSMRASQGKGRNPIIVGGAWKEDSPWWGIDPENLGIIEIPRSSIPEEALIVNYDIGAGGNYGLEEARIYSDIALPKPKPRVSRLPELTKEDIERGLIEMSQDFDTFDDFSRAYSVEGMRPRSWHITEPGFVLDPERRPTSRTGAPSPDPKLFTTVDPDTWEEYTEGRDVVIEYDLSNLVAGRDFFSDMSGNEGIVIMPWAFPRLVEVARLTRAEARERAAAQQRLIPQSKDELWQLWNIANASSQPANLEVDIEDPDVEAAKDRLERYGSIAIRGGWKYDGSPILDLSTKDMDVPSARPTQPRTLPDVSKNLGDIPLEKSLIVEDDWGDLDDDNPSDAFTMALGGESGTTVHREQAKAAVQDQLTRRIYDHALANPEFMEWLSNHGEMEGYETYTIRDLARATLDRLQFSGNRDQLLNIEIEVSTWDDLEGQQFLDLLGQTSEPRWKRLLSAFGIRETGPYAEDYKLFKDYYEELEARIVNGENTGPMIQKYDDLFENLSDEGARRISAYTQFMNAYEGREIDGLTISPGKWYLATEQERVDIIERLIAISGNYPYEELLISRYTRHTIHNWAGSSADNMFESLALQRVASSMFSVDDVATTEHFPYESFGERTYREEMTPFLEAFVRATYEHTQDYFKANGITHINVARGMKWKLDDLEIPNWAIDYKRTFFPRIVTDGQEINSTSDLILALVKEIIYASDDDGDASLILEERIGSIIDREVQRRLDEELAAGTVYDVNAGLTQEEIDFEIAARRDDIVEDVYGTDTEDAVLYGGVNNEYVQSVIDDVRLDYYRNEFQPDYDDVRRNRAEIIAWLYNDFYPEDLTVVSQPLSSWSTSFGTADGFAFSGSRDFYGLQVSARVPVERIFTTCVTGIGCLSENEVVIVGSEDTIGTVRSL